MTQATQAEQPRQGEQATPHKWTSQVDGGEAPRLLADSPPAWSHDGEPAIRAV
jgi:hypothetical protein